MYARAVDDAATRLRELRQEELGDLALGGLALALALAAAQVRPALALPLFIGGVVVGAFGVRALYRRWDLVERLLGERDAYVIPEVRVHATRMATIESRRRLAASIRLTLTQPGIPVESRVRAAADELGALASVLDDDMLQLDPVCAVACLRLVSDHSESPLLNHTASAGELRAAVVRIRSGFTASRAAA
jgi:hypothetical protein